MKKICCIMCKKCRKPKNPKNHKFSKKKTSVLFIICCKCENEDKKIFIEEESFAILKIYVLIINLLLK